MKFFDDRSKKIKWWNRNYFFAGTILVVLVNILLFAFLGGSFQDCVKPDNIYHWHNGFYFIPTLRSFINAFSHSNWQHVLLNMLCFIGIGLYLERKTGSLGLIAFVLFGNYISGIAMTTNEMTLHYHGFSGVNYFMYAIIIIDYVFSFQKDERNKTNIILGGIILGLIYLAMCFNDGLTNIYFSWYPYDLITNLGHGSSFVVGLVVGLIIRISMVIGKKYIIEKK